jgi:hypothetical protein
VWSSSKDAPVVEDSVVDFTETIVVPAMPARRPSQDVSTYADERDEAGVDYADRRR